MLPTLLVAAPLALALAVPAAALGAEARVEADGGDLVLVYDGGIAQQDGTITFNAAARDYRVNDPKGINPGPGCANLNPDTVTCEDTGIDRIDADLGAAADSLVVAANVTIPVIADGGAGDDSLIGGGGGDDLRGNTDNDSVRGFSGDDQVAGGLGDDLVDGGAGDDSVTGFVAGFDSIGGGGNDIISGGTRSPAAPEPTRSTRAAARTFSPADSDRTRSRAATAWRIR